MAGEIVDLHDNDVELGKAQATVRRLAGDNVEPIDILHHKLARSVQVPVTAGRSLDQAAVFGETRSAYHDLAQDLRAAIGLS